MDINNKEYAARKEYIWNKISWFGKLFPIECVQFRVPIDAGLRGRRSRRPI